MVLGGKRGEKLGKNQNRFGNKKVAQGEKQNKNIKVDHG